MKRTKQIIALTLMFLITGAGSVYAQRGVRGLLDTTRLSRTGTRMDFNQPRSERQDTDSLFRRGIRRGMGPGNLYPGRVMRDMPMYGMRRGFYPGIQGPYGRGSLWMDRMPAGRGRIERPDPGRSYYGKPYPGRPYYDRPSSERRWSERPYYDRIPGLTENQRKEINDLRQKQQEEMSKFREENLKKMEKIREQHRQKIMDLLTPEQKKVFE